ncbi:MAG: hypothetical protein LCH58_06010 [Bacteroidetes bacterium]|uniref:hypothetical protein n=1 Tax=Phnomibacter sp. TaxID=2836217 RepID=UPI002FDD95F0|nr:hypothetical protein [Bacteroidota bacterium]
MAKIKSDEMKAHLLKIISAEIEQRFNCKVVDISLCSIIGTVNVQVKIQYNDDFVYKPNEHWTIESIVFSEKCVRFFRRIDFFECVKKLGVSN